MANKNLNAAKVAKKDEFYTQLSDIERELQHYWKHFRGKVVLCNCDDPYESNFFKYFALRFNQLGLKKLICTCYNGSPVTGNELAIHFDGFDDDEPKKIAYKVEITEVKDENGDGAVDLSDVQYLLKSDRNVLSILKTGDFRSQECIELLKEADIVVTNPPFSLFREYIGQLMEYKKKFLIIGSQKSIGCKEIFPLFQENKIWWGYGFKGAAAHFFSPYEDTATAGDHKKDMIRVSGVTWFTNLEIPKRSEEIFWAETLGMRSSRFSMVPAFSSTDPTTVVVIPPFFRIVLGREDFTTTSPSILLSSSILIMPTFSPVQSLQIVL